ncbi:MAG: hypothetical protein UU47_C0022G0003 [candidate division TM6 bacterium GW2011_GWE2_41_16]|nr:MAG: hypothetical protein UU47_C0022G0003 [candidate division TM6 bacterium GW2011_GWE2_41_16]
MFCMFYFGDAIDGLVKKTGCAPYDEMPYQQLAQKIGAKSLVLLEQIHGKIGVVVDAPLSGNELCLRPGDFLITNVPGVAIGVLTADCVPIICIDESKQVVAVIHAGWRGAVSGVIETCFDAMGTRFGCCAQDLKCMIGPCGGACCYQVSDDFCAQTGDPCVASFFVKQSHGHMFDLVGYVKNRMLKAGVPAHNIDDTHHVCTICHTHYCSWRRDQNDQRNATVAMINSKNNIK